MVPTMRLELIRLTSLPPQDSVSTNFTTSAKTFYYLRYLLLPMILQSHGYLTPMRHGLLHRNA